MKTVTQLNHDGYFVGTVCAEESPLEPGVYLIPAGCIEMPPPAAEAGMRYRHDGAQWMAEPIPAAEPLQEPAPMAQVQPEPAPYVPKRDEQIKGRLFELDHRSVRSSRAIAVALASNAVPNAGDVQTLADIETEAAALRAELATLA